MTRTYWHIAHHSYQPGDTLKSWNDLRDEGHEAAFEWKWDEADAGFDSDVICVFPDTARGRIEADWLWSDHPDSHLLRIDIPDDEDPTIVTVQEGYPALYSIPAEWITLVRSGYAENTVTHEGDSY